MNALSRASALVSATAFLPAVLPLALALGACSSDDSSVTPPAADGGLDTGAPDSSTADASGSDAGTTAEGGSNDGGLAERIPQAMHDALVTDLQNLVTASQDIQNAAPTPTDRGWDAAKDAAAIAAMKDAWKRARTAYEHIEGATAPIFPDIDFSIDARYDDFLTDLQAQNDGGAQGDTNLFDDRGVTGLHAVERVLYSQASDDVPASVVAFEKTLAGYKAPSFPATAAEASDFKTKLVKKLIDDAAALRDQWTPAKIDVSGSFIGLVGLMNEQKEKVLKAATGEEESRYSQRTMDDLRDNLTGTTTIYALFGAAIKAAPAGDGGASGTTIDTNIEAGFTALRGVYAAYPSDGIPTPPADWSSVQPTASNLATDFGKLYTAVLAAVDPTQPGSVVSQMNDAATLLDYPLFQPE